MTNVKAKSWLLFMLSGFLYIFIEYAVMRHETSKLLISLGVLFSIYVWISKSFDESEVTFWLLAAISFRVSLLFAVPNLSDDFYRFIWDGRLLASGYHPFAELPGYYVNQTTIITPGIDKDLFQKLNSPNYFTIYPPVNQFIFWLSVKLSPHSILGSVIVMRSVIISAEIGTILLIQKILKHYSLPAKNILIYALNPLVIIELTGNLHFEALLIFFMLCSFWLLINEKMLISAFCFALAICSKLIPIIVLPLILSRLGLKKSLQYYILVGLCCVLLFLPLLNVEIISGFRESISYYFKKFEFNASLYYLVREWGFWKYGYNIIQTAGWKLAMWCTMVILVYTFFDERFRNHSTDNNSQSICVIDNGLLTGCLFVFTIYFIFSAIVHPWYIATLVAFSVFSSYRFAILWSALIFLTYAGYTSQGFNENLWLIAMEYILVMCYLAYELAKQRKLIRTKLDVF